MQHARPFVELEQQRIRSIYIRSILADSWMVLTVVVGGEDKPERGRSNCEDKQ